MNALLLMLSQAETAVYAATAIFVRIYAIAFFLPGIAEGSIPHRIKVAGALAFAAVAWPMLYPTLPPIEGDFLSFAPLLIAEAASGLLIGFSVRAALIALQTAGHLIAQHLSLSQLFAQGVAPEPEPTIATVLTLAGIAFAMTLGLHVKAAALIVESYGVLPLGVWPVAGDAASWTVERVASAFNLAVALALPFIVMSFAYNLALGFINRAMPQLMVAFVGLPAITGLGLALLTLTAGAAVTIWHERFDQILVAPLGV
ncbi:MAG: flagellar biosynthetic protein FliR [Pseudomonadota bacterium]